jgi:hypothetical protein
MFLLFRTSTNLQNFAAGLSSNNSKNPVLKSQQLTLFLYTSPQTSMYPNFITSTTYLENDATAATPNSDSSITNVASIDAQTRSTNST